MYFYFSECKEGWCLHHGGIKGIKRFLSYVHLPQTNSQHPSTNRSAFVEALGSATIHPSTWKESHPPIHCMIDRLCSQAFRPLGDPGISSSPSWLRPEIPGDLLLRQAPTEKRAFVEVQFQRGCSSPLEQKLWVWMHCSGHLIKAGGGGCYFKCEDSSTKLKGTSKIKETWHHQRITIIFYYQSQAIEINDLTLWRI